MILFWSTIVLSHIFVGFFCYHIGKSMGWGECGEWLIKKKEHDKSHLQNS